MRIGIFSECYLPTLNGVTVSIETFRKELERRGHKYFITKIYQTSNSPAFSGSAMISLVIFSIFMAREPLIRIISPSLIIS